MPYQVIIPAAGQGKRMGVGKNKLLLDLNGIPVFIHTLRVFETDEECESIVLAIHPNDEVEFKTLLENHKITKVIHIVSGGKERQHSINNALKTVSGNGVILVHDAARPFVKKEHIHRLMEAAEKYGAAILGVPAKDTMKKVQDGKVVETVERTSLWAVQTPQAFRMSILLEANELAEKENFVGTDDASLVERLSVPIKMVQGDYDNIKLTTPEDLLFAEAILKKTDFGHKGVL
jgi:2-C-methyl-D-erythritol 4-phosphate cytidylyltransferase